MVKEKAQLVITGIGQLLTMDPASDNPSDRRDPVAGLGLVIKAAVAIRDGSIVWCGRQAELDSNVDMEGAETIDAAGCAVLPGLIDCHTHLVFAGSRAHEFARRLAGDSYEQILAAGGGIHSTVEATRRASEETLAALAQERLDRFLAQGVTTVEVKSGYGLDLESELKILRAVRSASAQHPIELVPTFLGAHVVPVEMRGKRERYLEAVIKEMLPAVAEEHLAEFCDVFCDEGAFSVDEARRILEAARQLGLGLKLHGEQLGRTGAARLAAELGAASVDHLEKIAPEDAARLARSGTVAVLLSGATYFLGRRDYAPGRMLADAGCRVAVSTDFNPGSCMSENLSLMLNMACLCCGLFPREAMLGATRQAAAALGRENRLGVIAPGRQADLVILDSADYRNLLYHFGVEQVKLVIKKGRLVYSQQPRSDCLLYRQRRRRFDRSAAGGYTH